MPKPLLRRVEVTAWLLVAAAGLTPVVEETRTYWGLYEVGWSNEPPRVHTVDPDSPAAADGFRVDDVILSADGTPQRGRMLAPDLCELPPGRAVVARVRRDGGEAEVRAVTVRPRAAAVYYQTEAHPAFGGLAAGVGLFLALGRWPGPRWRGGIGLLLGLGYAAWHLIGSAWPLTFFWTQWLVWQQHVRNGGETWHLGWFGFAAAVVTAGVGAAQLADREPDPPPAVDGD